MNKGRETFNSGLGHICTGGGARIENSPINLHIHIHANSVSIATKIGRAINGLINKERYISIEGAGSFSEADIQGRIIRAIEN